MRVNPLIFAAVPQVTHIVKKLSTPLERFLGGEAKIMANSQADISRYICAEWTEVCYDEHNMPEEQGLLHLFPIDDNQFCLQLLYLQYAEGRPFTVNVCSLRFMPGFFDQYPIEALMANRPFRFDQSTEQQFSVCTRTRSLLDELQELPASFTPLIRSLQQSETAMHLLRRALECITLPFSSCQVPACRFLAYDSERNKIEDARAIIEQQFDQTLTIRELSRKVAMNECYLKKGFKALVGKTIHEYQHELRIGKARLMLQQEGRSVSHVAGALGYSSISHFSTAFKKATGLKPCELLK